MRATFLGRFQPLHEGHYRAIRQVRAAHDAFVLALGSPEKSRTPENPLSATEREELLHVCVPNLNVVYVADEDRGEAGYPVWARRLVERTDADVVVSDNDLVRRLVREHTDAAVARQELHSPERYSGTEVRRRIRAGEPWRELVPDCCVGRVEQYADVVRRSGEGSERD
ncbi:MAG: adenylyltransferase/cytidyltransferase family protein [Haloarculaceae archaeon]